MLGLQVVFSKTEATMLSMHHINGAMSLQEILDETFLQRVGARCTLMESWKSPAGHNGTLPLLSHLLYLLLLLFFTYSSYSQPSRFSEEWRWAEFTTTSGLPSNYVYEIVETEQATVWAFTQGGIAWYDGFVWHPVSFATITAFRKPESFNSDSRGRIILVYDSTLYIGDTSGFTNQGISNIVCAVPLSDDRVLLLRSDKSGHQWLEILDGKNTLPVPPATGIDMNLTLHVCRTRSGTVWLGSGRCWFNFENGSWKRRFCVEPLGDVWWHNALAENSSHTGFAFGFRKDRALELWEWKEGREPGPVPNRMFSNDMIISSDISNIGTLLTASVGGYFHLKYHGQWSTLHLQKLWAHKVEMLRFRKNGDVWFCTDRGLFLFKYSSERWTFIPGAPWPHGSVNDILVASDSSLWLAGDISVRVHEPGGTTRTIAKIAGQEIRAATGVLEAPDHSMWICSGSGFRGVFRWSRSRWERIGQGTPLAHAYIHRMRLDRHGRIWLLGIPGPNPPPNEEGPGVFVYENGAISRWSVPSNRVYAMDEARDSSMWFGTHVGLSRWHEGTWTHWSNKELFMAERVFTLAIDKEQLVWFSDSKGIVGYIDANNRPRRVTRDAGLINEQVWEMKVDKHGRLWCTTPAGLAIHFNGSWSSVDEELGLRTAMLWPVLLLDNVVYIGSMNGLAILRLPELGPQAPRLHLDAPLITESAAVIRWTAFARWADFPPERSMTRFRIDDKPWSQWSRIRETTIEDLKPGDHVYTVQSKPLLGGDSTTYNTVRGTFAIRLPLRKDPRVFIPAAVVLLSVLFVTLWSTTHARRLKAQQLRDELRREHEHSERLAEVDRLKSRFFANISHEFRTPLTLILGPIQQMLSQTKDERMRDKLLMANRNAEKLHALINQLLDFAKIEAGTMRLTVAKGDFVSFVQRVVQSFLSWAEQKKLTLKFETDRENIEGYFDSDVVEKILNNLISNAIKFTPPGGVVNITLTSALSDRERNVIVIVSDTGIGIAPDYLPHIFERFFRVDESHRTEGAGIGLALTKELIELHHGTVSVNSTIGEGSVFTVSLPLEGFATGEIEPAGSADKENQTIIKSTHAPDAHRDDSEPPEHHQTIVLVVEDSTDVKTYIREYLVSEYTVIEADDGAEALEKARASIPDLVVSDVMMPHMDGYELCKKLKRDERTSHIPVILLTARSGLDNKIEGLELGADDYLTKPFDVRELLVRIRNLIDGRRKLREHFGRAVLLKPGEITVASLEDAFLQKAMAAVEKRMCDEKFSVEQFSIMMAMSRMQLHRKLRALTGKSASEFVRYLRLHRAQELLTQHAATVSDAAYQTGFGSVTYFTRCYHEQYGCTPSETLERSAKEA